MVSEWEELESLSKDELIIELVRSRWQLRNLRKVLADLASDGGSYCQYEPGQKPSAEWSTKIAEYVFRNGPADLEDWGVDESTANALFDERFDFDDAFEKNRSRGLSYPAALRPPLRSGSRRSAIRPP